MNSIFANTNIFNFSDPQPSWLFYIIFYNNTNNGTSFIDHTRLVAESVTLPSYETELVTKKYFGSEKTFPVLRTYGTDVEMQFSMRTETDENKTLFELAQLNARNTGVISNSENSIQYPVHPELEQYNTDVATWEYYTVDKVEVRLVDRVGNPTDSYTFNNCVLKSFSFDSNLDYTTDTYLRCKLVYHSDIWTHSQFAKTENV